MSPTLREQTYAYALPLTVALLVDMMQAFFPRLYQQIRSGFGKLN
jgi:hypothetical protein